MLLHVIAGAIMPVVAPVAASSMVSMGPSAAVACFGLHERAPAVVRVFVYPQIITVIATVVNGLAVSVPVNITIKTIMIAVPNVCVVTVVGVLVPSAVIGSTTGVLNVRRKRCATPSAIRTGELDQ
jgi:hypothetical protein